MLAREISLHEKVTRDIETLILELQEWIGGMIVALGKGFKAQNASQRLMWLYEDCDHAMEYHTDLERLIVALEHVGVRTLVCMTDIKSLLSKMAITCDPFMDRLYGMVYIARTARMLF